LARLSQAFFSKSETFLSCTLELAGDAISSADIETKFSAVSSKAITYARFLDDLLEKNTFLGSLAQLIDERRLAGNADIDALRQQFPGLLNLNDSLTASVKPLLKAAMSSEGGDFALP
jgi:hypothetical protein